MDYEERQKWFTDRIGKRVYRNKTCCECEICKYNYENGLIINDDTHAIYLTNIEACSSDEGIPIRYFDTKEEVETYEILAYLLTKKDHDPTQSF